MAQGNNPQRQHTTPESDLVKRFLENQNVELELQKEELQIRKQELAHNAKLSELSLKYQAEHLKSQPQELRKTLTRIAYIIAGLVVVILAFIAFCLFNNKDEFVNTFLKGLSYIVTSILSFLAGKKVTKSNTTDTAEKIQEY